MDKEEASRQRPPNTPPSKISGRTLDAESAPSKNEEQQRPQVLRSSLQNAEPVIHTPPIKEDKIPRPRAKPFTPQPRRAHIPANDDMPSIGGLIYALQQRPSRSPFLVALIASAIWACLGLLLSWAVFQDAVKSGESFGQTLSHPAIAAVVATIIIPIALFWFLAILVWRAQELRLMSSAMTEVAVRLAEPDRMAEQSVASLGQTVRRQVAAMNAGIEHALSRAGELDAIVQGNLRAIERATASTNANTRARQYGRGKIFLNYRRADAKAEAARLNDRLVAVFGTENVFMDVDTLLAGERFDLKLEEALKEADVFLAIIGSRWMDFLIERAKSGDRDFVREEIAAALARGIIVIPVLMDEAQLPGQETLPSDIRNLVLHQKYNLKHESFNRDAQALINVIKANRASRDRNP
jgi:hypothetical protein